MKTDAEPKLAECRWERRLLIAIFLAALLLRAILAIRGGQGFWPDESRYNIASDAAENLRKGQYEEMAQALLGSADHLGFKIQMVPVALLQATHRQWSLAPSAIVVGLYSAGCLVWIWLIARRLGGGVAEAFWASLAGLGSCSLLYYSRHLLPYDLALFWGLACLYVGLAQPGGKRNSLLAGVLGFIAFVTYNGYWTLVGFVLVVHVLRAGANGKRLLSRAFFAGLGLGGSFVLLLVAARLLGVDLLESYASFATTITQGDFAEGHRLLADYLWQTERGSLLVWIAGAAVGLVLARQAAPEARRRLWLYLTGAAVVTLTLITGSNFLHKFVVYGRLVRQVIPFLAMITGWTFAELLARRPHPWWWKAGLALLILGCAVPAMTRPFRQIFPREFVQRGARVVQNYPRPAGLSPEARTADDARFHYLNVTFFWPVPGDPPPLPPYDIVLRAEHPQHWLPYLYEGFRAEQRRTFLAKPLEMELVRVRE